MTNLTRRDQVRTGEKRKRNALSSSVIKQNCAVPQFIQALPEGVRTLWSTGMLHTRSIGKETYADAQSRERTDLSHCGLRAF
ncbi:hypothetical protein Tco_0653915 [Tanacetum coccineum]|uniref:Uncharacterized protein n=1 Tax=Tanacetum coccineum TaxID=301880 RepID=A0ABQ4X2P4_9ASTR